MTSQNRRLTMKDNQAKYPQLRFKGFTDPWERRKLANVVSISAGGDVDKTKLIENGGYPVLANALTNSGIVGYYDSYKVEAPAVTVTGRGDVGHAVARHVNFTPVVRLLSLKSEVLDADFLANMLNQTNILVESTGVPQLTAPQLGSYKILYPNLNEQTKIGKLLNAFDNLIALHQRKLAKLKELKQGYLQKLFPKNGSKFPQLRFSGFADAWEERKLGNELTLLKDGTHGTHQDVIEGPFLLSAKNIKNGKIIIDEITDRKISVGEYNSIHKRFSLEKGDVLLTIVGSIGETAIIENPIGITFQRSVAYLRPSHTILSQFLFTTINGQKFQMELRKRQVVSAQPGIYLGDLSIIPILIPSVAEQAKIGSFFEQLDKTIALHQRKLEKLQELKKGYLPVSYTHLTLPTTERV